MEYRSLLPRQKHAHYGDYLIRSVELGHSHGGEDFVRKFSENSLIWRLAFNLESLINLPVGDIIIIACRTCARRCVCEYDKAAPCTKGVHLI